MVINIFINKLMNYYKKFIFFIHSSLYIFPTYLLPESCNKTTTTSSFLKCFFNCKTPLIAAPQEFPAKIPSSLASFLVKIAASLSVTFSK